MNKLSIIISCHFPRVVLSCYNTCQVLQGPPHKSLMTVIPKDIHANRDILAHKEFKVFGQLYYPPS